MQPVVPQPGTAPAPAKPVDQADEQLEWVLVPKGTPATTPSSTVTTPPAEPEPEKVSDKLADAQSDVNKVQWLVESSLCILIEPRRAYPIDQFGTYLPAEKIEVITAITTLTSIFLSGYRFF